MGAAFSETRRAVRLLQQPGGFPFYCGECDTHLLLLFDAARQGSVRSIGTLVRRPMTGEVPAILFLEQPTPSGGYSVIKVQGLHTGSSCVILIGYTPSITDPQTVARP